jgi:hypothetical protein
LQEFAKRKKRSAAATAAATHTHLHQHLQRRRWQQRGGGKLIGEKLKKLTKT